MMDKSSMQRQHWLAFRHPFLSAAVGAAGVVAMWLMNGSALSTSVIAGLAVAAFILVLWWPRRGVLTRQAHDWLDDDDPRVVKPGEDDRRYPPR
jgi:hypothetical protein